MTSLDTAPTIPTPAYVIFHGGKARSVLEFHSLSVKFPSFSPVPFLEKGQQEWRPVHTTFLHKICVCLWWLHLLLDNFKVLLYVLHKRNGGIQGKLCVFLFFYSNHYFLIISCYISNVKPRIVKTFSS